DVPEPESNGGSRQPHMADSFPEPKTFAGNNIPFVGFTYSDDYQLLSGPQQQQHLKNMLAHHAGGDANSRRNSRKRNSIQMDDDDSGSDGFLSGRSMSNMRGCNPTRV